MQDIPSKLRRFRMKNNKDKFMVVVDFGGTLFALGPDKDHIKDPFIPDDAEIVLGAAELDPDGWKKRKSKPFQGGVQYGWTTIYSVTKLLDDLQGVNIIASSVAGDAEQASLQKAACRDNHINIDHIMTKDAEAITNMDYNPSTIVVLGDTSSDVRLAEKIAMLSPKAKVICGFTPTGMEQQKTVQEVLDKKHPNIEFISGGNWSVVIRKLRKRVPLKSDYLTQFKKYKSTMSKLQRQCLKQVLEKHR